MARNLAHERDSDGEETSQGTDAGKQLLDRREYMLLGAAATATAVSVGSGLTGAANTTEATELTTDFSEYVA